jgi:hypothetical protein
MVDRPFWFHPDASAEALAAHDRYAAASAAAGASFQDELENARLAIGLHPLRDHLSCFAGAGFRWYNTS